MLDICEHRKIRASTYSVARRLNWTEEGCAFWGLNTLSGMEAETRNLGKRSPQVRLRHGICRNCCQNVHVRFLRWDQRSLYRSQSVESENSNECVCFVFLEGEFHLLQNCHYYKTVKKGCHLEERNQIQKIKIYWI